MGTRENLRARTGTSLCISARQMTLAIELEHHKLSSDFYHATSQVSSYVSKSATLNLVPSGCARSTLKKQLFQMKMTWLCVAGSNLWAVSFGIAEY